GGEGPSGPIGPPRPTGGRFGCTWDDLAKHRDLFRRAAAEFPPADANVMACMAAIESDANHTRGGKVIERWDNYPQDGPSVGIMQVKPKIWQPLVPDADAYTLEGNIRLGTAVMADAMKRHGGWREALVRVYFPENDPNGTTQNAYVKTVAAMLDEIEAGGGRPDPKPKPPKPDPKTPLDPWRPYPYPPMVDLVVQKPAHDGAGFNRCAFRRPLIRGFATHITDGPPSQTIEFFAEFFGTGGARAWDALTDLVIGWDGRIGLLNDWRDPNRGGTRAGWANGGVDGLEGEGVAFYRRFPDINVHLVSCEHCQKAGGRWSDAMLESTVEMRTAIAQELKCPADAYPYHPAYGGVSIEQQHRNFATKSCPATPYTSEYDAVVRREVKAKLRAWQGGDVEPPAPEPVKTFTDWGLTEEQVAHYFGTMTRVNPDGTADDLTFDPNGPLSLLWLKRAEQMGKFPESEEMRQFPSTVGKGLAWFATWEGGDTAFKPAGDTRAGWAWLDETKEAARAAAGLEEGA
ncbi:MAG: hypothetical protein M3Q10_14630, partial [Chloroflexota bacterium]|nr:hypothetical protein [Chloroflexota bacterium]